MSITKAKVSELKEMVRDRDGRRCTECGIPDDVHVMLVGKTLEVHRLNPGSKYTIAGCVTLCFECHKSKVRSRKHEGDRTVVKLSRGARRHLWLIAAHLDWPQNQMWALLEDILAAESAHTELIYKARHKRAEESERLKKASVNKGKATRRNNAAKPKG